MTTLYSIRKEIEHRRNSEGSSFEPLDFFKKNIRKFLFLDETPKNDNDRTRQFGSQFNWRQRKPVFENRSIPDEQKKQFPSWMKKNNTNSDKLSEEERNRLMREGKCFKCKKRGHRARDCPPDEDQSPQNKMKKTTVKDLVSQVKALTKKERMELVELMKGEERPDLKEEEEELDSMEEETAPAQISPSLDVYSVIATIDSQSMNIPMTISLDERGVTETDSLLDSGAGGIFIDQNYAQRLHLDIKMLDIPVKARNVDGTENKRGTIKSYVNLRFRIGNKYFLQRFFLPGLGKQTVILGFPWLKKHNPLVNWQTGHIDWRDKEEDTQTDSKSSIQKEKDVQPNPKPSMKEEDDEEQWKNRTVNPIDKDEDDEDDTLVISYLEEIAEEELWINAKMNIAVELAIKESEKEGKKEIPMEELVPEDLHDFLDVFNEKQADRFPDSRPWDHKIEMKEGFEPKSFKTYNLSPTEQIELDKFLKENLDKGYIRPSQSPMASPFFFVTKKDGRLRPCQDYHYLNDWTIKNAYPLPLISEIMDKLKRARYFTKFEWKGAFKTNRGLYEPTVMFFGMCNSPATFQSMMDSIFAQEIEGNLVIIYMDDILIFAPTLE